MSARANIVNHTQWLVPLEPCGSNVCRISPQVRPYDFVCASSQNKRGSCLGAGHRSLAGEPLNLPIMWLS
jgi:hypothetical protein